MSNGNGKSNNNKRRGKPRTDEASFCPVACTMEELDAAITAKRKERKYFEAKFLEGVRHCRVIHRAAGVTE